MSLRHSLLRDAILSLLGQHHLLTAPELLRKLHKVGRKVNKTSMYRALQILQTQGQVCRQNFEQNEVMYERASSHHDHAVCLECGQITSVECQLSITQGMEGFTSNHHHVTFFGKCSKCSISSLTASSI